MTYAVTVLAAACCVLGFLLVCALVGGSDQRAQLQAKVDRLQAQVVGLTEMNTSKAKEIRRFKIGASNHPAGKALSFADGCVGRHSPATNPICASHLRPVDVNVIALREALEERDAGHEGAEGA